MYYKEKYHGGITNETTPRLGVCIRWVASTYILVFVQRLNGHLIVVQDNANQSKGAKGLENCLPSNVSYRCQYVKDWEAIKQRWGLYDCGGKYGDSQSAGVASCLAV